MNKLVTYAVYEPEEICAVCKGECCRFYACHYSPEDFPEISFEALKKQIDKGRISIDWWEADSPEYFLRARHVGEPVVCGSWGGVCVNLTDTGCSLSWDERPLGGKALRPKDSKNGSCKTSYNKEACKNDWKKYADVLRKLALHYEHQQMLMEEKNGSE